MKAKIIIHAIGTALTLFLLCSCMETRLTELQSPAEVPMNEEAGRGGPLLVTLEFNKFKNLQFLVDSGTQITFFDKSLEPMLGRSLGTSTFSHFGLKKTIDAYAAPTIYLQGKKLQIGSRIYCDNFDGLSQIAGHPIMGILGMDCLHNYCVQLDFSSRKIRFLDSKRLDRTNLGKPISLVLRENLPFVRTKSLFGGKTSRLLIDTGFNADGIVTPPRSPQSRGGKQDVLIASNERATDDAKSNPSSLVWIGNTYTNLIVFELPAQSPNLLGLRFLARHLVTLDFPRRTLFLKQTSIGPISGDRFFFDGQSSNPEKSLE